jgi:hypothetical protein
MQKYFPQFKIGFWGLFIYLCFNTLNIKAQVSINASIGTTTGSFSTLKGAFDAINVGTHVGTITITISGNTSELASAVLNASGSGTSSYSSVQIVPADGIVPI